MKKKRVFFHYNKCKKLMSVHFDKKCHIVKNIRCEVPTETKYNKRQPYLVMIGSAREVTILEDTAIIL